MVESWEGYIETVWEEHDLVRRLDMARLPGHVAVIMDGNGRWAKKRGLSRIEGHRAGSDSVREIVETSARLGIKVLTLYAFSKENWKRPRREVSELWSLLRGYLKKDARVLMENDLRLLVIGLIGIGMAGVSLAARVTTHLNKLVAVWTRPARDEQALAR